jgi:hypothetical protein
MKKYEYTVVYMEGVLSTKKTEKQLNELGEDGWELTCAVDSVMFLKREKQEAEVTTNATRL